MTKKNIIISSAIILAIVISLAWWFTGCGKVVPTDSSTTTATTTTKTSTTLTPTSTSTTSTVVGSTTTTLATNTTTSSTTTTTVIAFNSPETVADSSSTFDMDLGSAHFFYQFGKDNFHADNVNGSWDTKLVDTSVIEVGKTNNPGISVASSGYPHVSYYDSNTTALKYAYKAAGGWTLKTISSLDNSGKRSSIAVYDDQNKHIAYYYISASNKTYIYHADYDYANGNWDLRAIDEMVNDVRPIIVLNTNLSPRVAYCKSNGLQYGKLVNSAWNTYTVSDSAKVVSMDLGSDDTAYIAYLETGEHLTLATGSDNSWTIQRLVDGAGHSTFDVSIAVDRNENNTVHIAYIWAVEGATNNRNIDYVTNRSGSWKTYRVVSNTFVQEVRIKIDENHKAHIGYSEGGNLQLKYVSQQ
ncbi:MAG: hypothetical protein JW782_07165 [Candidatus Saganbacteria bacterium]|nr:hypothetical protein [Candidatus Saganbacteria bacterium]